MDAVLLSAFAKVKKGERALDLGTGTGILPILLEAKNGESPTQAWRYRRRVRIWPAAVSCTTTWRTESALSQEISERQPPFSVPPLFTSLQSIRYMIGAHGLKK